MRAIREVRDHKTRFYKDGVKVWGIFGLNKRKPKKSIIAICYV